MWWLCSCLVQLYHLALCQIWVIMATFSFCVLLWYLREEWIDLIHIWYSNQVPCVTFGSIPNLSNYGNMFIKFYVFVVISQERMGWFCSYWILVVHGIKSLHGQIALLFSLYQMHVQQWDSPLYSNHPQKGLNAYRICIGSVPKGSIYVHYFINFVCL